MEGFSGSFPTRPSWADVYDQDGYKIVEEDLPDISEAETAPDEDAPLAGARHSGTGPKIMAQSLYLTCYLCKNDKLMRFDAIPVHDDGTEVELCQPCYENEKNGGRLGSGAGARGDHFFLAGLPSSPPF